MRGERRLGAERTRRGRLTRILINLRPSAATRIIQFFSKQYTIHCCSAPPAEVGKWGTASAINDARGLHIRRRICGFPYFEPYFQTYKYFSSWNSLPFRPMKWMNWVFRWVSDYLRRARIIFRKRDSRGRGGSFNYFCSNKFLAFYQFLWSS